MSMMEAYVQNIPLFSLHMLESFSEKWLYINNSMRDVILPHIIKEKLKRYEEEN